MHLGFALVDVDPRGEDRPVLERDGERLFVDHRAAGGVHQHRGPLHQPESTCVDQAARLVVQRHVQRHDVGARQQVVEVGTHPVMPVSVRVWCSTSMPNPAARRATARPMRPYPTIPRVAPCTSTPGSRRCGSRSSGRRGGRLRRRSRGGTPRGRGGTRGRRSSRRAHRACCTPRCRAPPRRRRRCCRSPPRRWRRPAAAIAPASSTARSMRSVRMQTIASTSAASATSSSAV